MLLEFEKSKSLVSLRKPPDDLKDILEERLRRIDDQIRLVVDYRCQEEATTGENRLYLLQRWSKEWSEFIDVIDMIEIDNGDHLKVVPVPVLSRAEMPIVKKAEVIVVMINFNFMCIYLYRVEIMPKSLLASLVLLRSLQMIRQKL